MRVIISAKSLDARSTLQSLMQELMNERVEVASWFPKFGKLLKDVTDLLKAKKYDISTILISDFSIDLYSVLPA